MSAQVNSTCKAYDRMWAKWRLPLTLMEGTLGMRRARQLYLPQEPAEDNASYEARLNKTTLFNAYRKTVTTMAGKVFAKPPFLGNKMPPEIVEWSEDIDLTGRALGTFMQDSLQNAMVTGKNHILVDLPRVQSGATRADEQGIRPYFIPINAENLIGWQSEYVDGVQQLTQIRVREFVVEQDGEFGETLVERVRVYYRDRFEIWQVTGAQINPFAFGPSRSNSQWQIVDRGPMTLGVIPLATAYTNYTGFMESDPPLEDLAWLNQQHWQSYSDQRHILHVARVPLLFGEGLNQDDKSPVVVGPDRMVTGPQGSDLKYVEHQGHAITSGREDLQDLEERMRVMGLELVQPKPGNPTATGKLIDHGELMSPLQRMAVNLGDATETAFAYMLMWRNTGMTFKDALKQIDRVKYNTDFGLGTHATEDLRTLTAARKEKDISRSTYWDELKRRSVLKDDFDTKAEQGKIDAENEADMKFRVAEAEAIAATEPEEPEEPGTPPAGE